MIERIVFSIARESKGGSWRASPRHNSSSRGSRASQLHVPSHLTQRGARGGREEARCNHRRREKAADDDDHLSPDAGEPAPCLLLLRRGSQAASQEQGREESRGGHRSLSLSLVLFLSCPRRNGGEMETERKRERSLREKRGKKSDSLNGSERNFLRTSPSKKKKSLGDEDCCFFPSHPLRARFARRHREPTVRAAPTHRPPTPVPLLRRLSRGETQRCEHGGRASESQRRRRKKSRRREKKKTATSPQSRSLSDRAQKAPPHATPGLTSHAQCNLSCA